MVLSLSGASGRAVAPQVFSGSTYRSSSPSVVYSAPAASVPAVSAPKASAPAVQVSGVSAKQILSNLQAGNAALQGVASKATSVQNQVTSGIGNSLDTVKAELSKSTPAVSVPSAVSTIKTSANALSPQGVMAKAGSSAPTTVSSGIGNIKSVVEQALASSKAVVDFSSKVSAPTTVEAVKQITGSSSAGVDAVKSVIAPTDFAAKVSAATAEAAAKQLANEISLKAAGVQTQATSGVGNLLGLGEKALDESGTKLKTMSVPVPSATQTPKVGDVAQVIKDNANPIDIQFKSTVGEKKDVVAEATEAMKKIGSAGQVTFASNVQTIPSAQGAVNYQVTAYNPSPAGVGLHPAANAYTLVDPSVDAEYLDCVDPTSFEWTMPSGKVGPNYVDAFGNQMSREQYISTYNVDPEYAYQYMRTGQAAKELAAIQSSRGINVAQLSSVAPSGSVSGAVGGSSGNGSGTVAQGSGTTQAAAQTWAGTKWTVPAKGASNEQIFDSLVASGNDLGDMSAHVAKLASGGSGGYSSGYTDYSQGSGSSESTTELSEEDQLRAYLGMFVSSAGIVDVAKVKTGDYQLYQILINAALIKSTDAAVSLEVLVKGLMELLHPTTTTTTPTSTTVVDTVPEDTQPVTAPVPEPPETDDDDTTTPVTVVTPTTTTETPTVISPISTLYINNRGYVIPDDGLDVAVIINDASQIVVDREKRKNFTSVITKIAGKNGKLDLSEVSKLSTIAGIPIRMG